jgi:hypothetical protein
MYVCVHADGYIYVHVCMCIYVRIYACAHTHLCECMYVCMCTCILQLLGSAQVFEPYHLILTRKYLVFTRVPDSAELQAKQALVAIHRGMSVSFFVPGSVLDLDLDLALALSLDVGRPVPFRSVCLILCCCRAYI